MATLFQIMAALQQGVKSAIPNPLIVEDVTISVQGGIDWPPVKVLQNVAREASAFAAYTVYDRKVGKDTTRWAPYPVSETITPAAITSEISGNWCGPGEEVTITLGATPNVGDGVSFCASIRGNGANGSVIQSSAAVAQAVEGDTAATMATKLAAAIMADSLLPTWFSVGVVGAVITITSELSVAAKVASYTGNGGSRAIEVGRRLRQFQLAFWTRTEEIRQALTDPIDGYLAGLQAQFGPVLSDGTPTRIMLGTDYYLADDTLEDVYRRDFLFGIEYPITTTDALYAVLAPVIDVTAD